MKFLGIDQFNEREKVIYLDNGATTMIDPKVLEVMTPYLTTEYGNPASVHILGREASIALEDARTTIAKSIGAKRSEIFFTSGGTESNNWALKSIAFNNMDKGKHIITTKIEHDCILNSCKWLKGLGMGFEITYLNVDKEGFIDVEELNEAIRRDTILVSIIHGNNEIGTIQEIGEIGKLCRDNNVYFHTDACQSYTKTNIDVRKQNIDLMTLNAHKIHGPKGIGALYIRRGVNIKTWQHGGGQERGMRSGTVNVAGVVGFAEAVKIGMDEKHIQYMKRLRNKLINGLLEIPDTQLNGPAIDKNKRSDRRLCNNINIRFKNVNNETLGNILNIERICTSAGSACSARPSKPSHVLKAIGLTDADIKNSIRLTLSRFNTNEEIDKVLEIMPGIIKKIRKGSFLDKFASYISR